MGEGHLEDINFDKMFSLKTAISLSDHSQIAALPGLGPLTENGLYSTVARPGVGLETVPETRDVDRSQSEVRRCKII